MHALYSSQKSLIHSKIILKTDIEPLAEVLSKLEHEADLTKNDIRNHMPRSLFLPIDRNQLLEILAIQDSISDKAEEIGNLLTLRALDNIKPLLDGLQKLFKKNAEAFWHTRQIVKELDDLVESTFGGAEAQKVKAMIVQTSYLEYESDKLKHDLTKTLFKHADNLPTPAFYLWNRLIEETGTISHISEKLAIRIRMILELK